MRLVADKVSKCYARQMGDSNRFFAVKQTSLEVNSGDFIALGGRSGSGKTTLLCMLSGLLKPDDGAVTLDGNNIYALNDADLSRMRNEQIAFIAQKTRAISSLSVWENILLPASLYKRKPDEQLALSLMEEMGIAEIKNSRPSELSGGELRRMAIVRAVASKPNFIFADEPTGDLDDENTDIALNILKRAADEGAGIIMISHDPTALNRAGKRLYMNAGEVKDNSEN